MFDLEYAPISQSSLWYRLQRERPRNTDANSGFALIYVLGGQPFERGHIPRSINIPIGHEHEFERRFSKAKEIVVYGDDRSLAAPAIVAKRLVERGFTRVYVYEAGMRGWYDAGCPLECGPERRADLDLLLAPQGVLREARHPG